MAYTLTGVRGHDDDDDSLIVYNTIIFITPKRSNAHRGFMPNKKRTSEYVLYKKFYLILTCP